MNWSRSHFGLLMHLVGVCALGGAFTGCMSAYKQSVGGEGPQVFDKIFLTDFNTAWGAVLEALKHNRIDVKNPEGGFIQTRWTDNTAERNFVDSFGTQDALLKAQYRLRVSVSKGFYNGQVSSKVSVQKEQLIQKDVLEGWKPLDSDSIDENTLLYRIGRLIQIKIKLAKLDEEKTKRAIEDSKF